MAALFQRTIRSKITPRNSSSASNSFSSLSAGEKRLSINESEVLRRMSADGVPADHAARVTSFIKKTVERALQEQKYHVERALREQKYQVERALREQKYQEYIHWLMCNCRPFLRATGYFALFAIVTTLPCEIDKKR